MKPFHKMTAQEILDTDEFKELYESESTFRTETGKSGKLLPIEGVKMLMLAGINAGKKSLRRDRSFAWGCACFCSLVQQARKEEEQSVNEEA